MSTFRSDHLLVRDYITAMDHLQYANLAEGIVAILLTHSNLPAKHVDIRLDLHMTVYEAKEKFRTHIGTSCEHQRLILKNNGCTILELTDNSKKLGFYSIVSGMEIHIVDTDPFSLSRGGGLTDTSLIEKYRLSDEAYNARKGTMREYIKEKRASNPNFKLKSSSNESKSNESISAEDLLNKYNAESVQHVQISGRCECMPGARRGVAMFVGEIPELKAGYWVGVKLDEPLGKSDGTVKTKSMSGANETRIIFECQSNYGAFVRGTNIVMGDFPEKDLLDELNDEEEVSDPTSSKENMDSNNQIETVDEDEI